MTCPCKKVNEIGTTNNVKNDFLPVTGLDLTEKIDVNYLNTESTKFPNDELEDLEGIGEPFPTGQMYSYGKEPPHEPYLSEFVPCDTYYPVQEIWIKETDVSQRKRVPAGSPEGGQFVSDGTTEPSEEEPEVYSQAKSIQAKRDYYTQKAKEYSAFDEQQGEIKIAEPIHVTSEPTDYHRATAYNVLKKHPEIDEEQMIQWAWEADKLRAAHEATTQQTLETLKAHVQTPNVVIYGRVKNRYGILEKMGRKNGRYKKLTDMGDISGFRIVSQNLQDVEVAKKVVNRDMMVKGDPDDMITNPQAGYRSVHYDIVNPDGTRSELQVRTPNENTWADFFHDRLYKIDESTPEGQEVKQNMTKLSIYSAEMSEYYYQLDMGNYAAIKPPCNDLVRRLIGCL